MVQNNISYEWISFEAEVRLIGPPYTVLFSLFLCMLDNLQNKSVLFCFYGQLN